MYFTVHKHLLDGYINTVTTELRLSSLPWNAQLLQRIYSIPSYEGVFLIDGKNKLLNTLNMNKKVIFKPEKKIFTWRCNNHQRK